MEQGRNGCGSPCLAHLAGDAPETTPGQELLLFPEGLQRFLQDWEAQVRDVLQAVTKANPGGSSSTSPCPDTHTPLFAPLCCSQPTIQHCRAAHDLSRKPKGCSLCCSTPLHGTQIIWEPGDLGGFWACSGGWLFPQPQPHSDSTWCSLPTRF